MTNCGYVVIEAPSTLGLASDGVEGLPTRMGELGFFERIGSQRIQRLPVPPKHSTRDPETLTLNTRAIVSWSSQLAGVVGAVLDNREFPVVLGGDCSIVLGSMLALRRRGRYGLMFIDGNADYFQPEAEPKGEAASMDLAFVTGRGPPLLTNLEGLGPLVRPDDAVAFGFRDHEDQAQYGSQPLDSEIAAIDLETARRLGIEVAARNALEHLTRSPLDGFFIHLDADCLDDAIMPAVDYRVPGGLSWSELSAVLGTMLGSDKASGLELTIYNPRLDRDGRSGRGLADTLAHALLDTSGSRKGLWHLFPRTSSLGKVSGTSSRQQERSLAPLPSAGKVSGTSSLGKVSGTSSRHLFPRTSS